MGGADLLTRLEDAVSQPGVWSSLLLAGAAGLALALIEAGFHALRHPHGRWAQTVGAAVTARTWWPARATAVALVADLALPGLPLAPRVSTLTEHGLTLALIAAVAWLLVGVSFALEDVALARLEVDVPDDLRARRVQTQVMVARRLTVVTACLLGLGIMLTTFASGRVLGTSLLASAGVLGVVVGIAARPILANLLAGLQILFSEPIRLDDVVVVEGQWGRVEEITFSYVVVHIWDDRRLILPVSYFLEQPFENWTRSSTSLLATVLLSVDFAVPVQAVREELQRILERSQLWDGQTWKLQVTDVGQGAVQLRALMSAADAKTAWDLRCEVREQLLAFLQLQHPESLPRTRVRVVEADGPPD